MTETQVDLFAKPVKEYHLEIFEHRPDLVVANYLPNSRAPHSRDYVVSIRTNIYVELLDGRTKRKQVTYYMFMTYAMFRKNFKWNPLPGQTSRQTNRAMYRNI